MFKTIVNGARLFLAIVGVVAIGFTILLSDINAGLLYIAAVVFCVCVWIAMQLDPIKRPGEVLNLYGEPVDFECAMLGADRDLCKQIANEYPKISDQQFFDLYAARHAKRYGELWGPWVD